MNFAKMSRRVHHLFEFARWKWGVRDSRKIPSRDEIRRKMCDLYDLVEEGAETAACGQLLCIKEEEEDGSHVIKMCVVVGEERWG